MGDDLGRANALLQVGTVQFRQGRNAEALESFQGADELFLKVGDDLGRANAWAEMARLRAADDDLDGALDLLKRVASVEASHHAWHNWAITATMRCDLLVRAGRQQEAEDTRTEAVARLRREGAGDAAASLT